MRRRTFLHLALVPFLAVSGGAPVSALQDDSQGADESQVIRYTGRAFVFEVDLAHARAARWIAEDRTEDEVLDEIEDTLKLRLRRAGRFVEARVLRDDDARLAVVFIGKQDDQIERFLIDGLSLPGRVGCRIVAEDADLDETTIAAERARLEAWRDANPEAELTFFHDVARADGGPHAELQWMMPWRATDVGAAVPLLRTATWTVSHRDTHHMGTGRSNADDGGDGLALHLLLNDEPRESLEAFRARWAGRTLATCLDESVLTTEVQEPSSSADGDVVDADVMDQADGGESPSERFILDGAFSMAEMRAIVFAAMGESLPCRLRFEGFDQRELMHVKPSGE